MPGLTAAASEFIIEHEVSGGRRAYDRLWCHPCWPGGHSGITIGVGYDLGQCTQAMFDADWGTRLPSDDLRRLRACIPSKGQAAHALLPGVRSITVPWAAASAVFYAKSLPDFYRQTLTAFPGADRLHPNAQAALVSLVFNRGGSMTDPKHHAGQRREMREIRRLVPLGDLRGIAAQIRLMKRLVDPSQNRGLLARRDEEAAMVESAIGQSATTAAATPAAGTPAAATLAAATPAAPTHEGGHGGATFEAPA